MEFLLFLNSFFTFLLNLLSEYIGTFFSVVILSFLTKLTLYKNQIDSLNNALKREVIQNDIDDLFQKFRKTRNLAKKKAIKNKKKLIKSDIGIIPFKRRILLIIIQIYVLASFIRSLYNHQIINNHVLWFNLNDKDHYYILPILVLLINAITEWPYKKKISNFIFYIIANICIFLLTTQLKSIILVYWITISSLTLIIKKMYMKKILPEIKKYNKTS